MRPQSAYPYPSWTHAIVAKKTMPVGAEEVRTGDQEPPVKKREPKRQSCSFFWTVSI